LFEFVAALPRSHRVALDCATGNGQAARGLSAYFDRVVATDASAEQIALAQPAEGIEYRVARADSSGLPDQSVDLVTVAQALHWLDPEVFFTEAKRVLAPGGAIAVWGYGDPVLDTPELQQILHRYNRGTIESYWHPERQLILDGYATVPFPFDEIAVPQFTLSRECTLPELIGYVRTWSATARYVAEHGMAEVEQLEADLARHWGDPGKPRVVDAPLHLRAGYVNSDSA
jgi:SAM-dependent methyltransferase